MKLWKNRLATQLLANTTRGWVVLGAAAAMVACGANVDPSSGDQTGEDITGNPASTESVASNSQGLVTDFLDNFDGSGLNGSNWQDQILWVNGEYQCYDNYYNEGGGHKTVEVSNGSLKLRVVDAGYNSGCNNWDKYGNKHGDTRYKGGRIASKNRKEFAGGRWTARLKLWSWTTGNGFGQASGLPGMFPAWWLLGNRNNEAPVQEGNENVCWPLTGSGEIDIMEHYGSGGQNQFAARGIKSKGYCDGGDWQSYGLTLYKDLNNYHEYQVEQAGSDLIYRIDNNEVARNYGIGQNYPEAMFAILNYAIKDQNMPGGIKEYVMEVDWVKHESNSSGGGGGGCSAGRTAGLKANANGLFASARADVSGVPVRSQAGSVQGWEQFDIVDAGGGYVGLKARANNLYVSTDMSDANKTLKARATSIGTWEKFQFVSVGNGWYGLKSAANGLYVSADLNVANGPLEAKWATSVGGWEQFQCP
jgi:hypothetical protein